MFYSQEPMPYCMDSIIDCSIRVFYLSKCLHHYERIPVLDV